MSKNLRLYLEIAEETKRLTMEGLEFNAALRKAKEIYKERAQTFTDQDKRNELDTKTTNCIISNTDCIGNRDKGGI